MNHSSIAEDSPVTIVAAHRVKPGREKAFERAMSHLIQAAIAFEGHLGANVLPHRFIRAAIPGCLQVRLPE